MNKGCAPDQAQPWAAQKKGVKEAGEETNLASQYWWTEDNLKPDMYIKMKSVTIMVTKVFKVRSEKKNKKNIKGKIFRKWTFLKCPILIWRCLYSFLGQKSLFSIFLSIKVSKIEIM